jgi:hypothetical protein
MLETVTKQHMHVGHMVPGLTEYVVKCHFVFFFKLHCVKSVRDCVVTVIHNWNSVTLFWNKTIICRFLCLFLWECFFFFSDIISKGVILEVNGCFLLLLEFSFN